MLGFSSDRVCDALLSWDSVITAVIPPSQLRYLY